MKTLKFVWIGIALSLAPLPAAASTNKPFTVSGRVLDERGRPMADVKIGASCGVATLFRTGETKTDESGNYRLSFAQGWSMKGPLGVGFQAASIYANKPGWCETNLCRQGNLAITDRPGPWEDASRFVGVVQPGVPRTLNFVMSPAASLKGTVNDADGRPLSSRSVRLGAFRLPPSSDVLASAITDSEGRFEFQDLPVDHPFWIGMKSRPGKPDLKSPAFVLPEPGAYSLRVTLKSGALLLEGPMQQGFSQTLLTRTYRIGTNQIVRNPIRFPQTQEGEAMAEILRRYFKTNGVQTEPPASLHFDATQGLLLVRNNQTNMNRIEELIEALSR